MKRILSVLKNQERAPMMVGLIPAKAKCTMLRVKKMTAAAVLMTLTPMMHAQQVRSVMADRTIPSSDYILASGIPGCASNPFDAVQAAANIIAGAETSGWIGSLFAALDEIGRSGKIGGEVGRVLEFIYGPRHASCAPVSVVIPAGSRIVNVEYQADDGVAGQQPCSRDGNGWIVCGIGWSLFEPAKVTPAGNSLIVTSIFKNWSDNRERGATMTVYFVPPNGY